MLQKMKRSKEMTTEEKLMWEVNIENISSCIFSIFGREVVLSVFQRYGANGFSDLNPCYYSEVFADLEQIANDK